MIHFPQDFGTVHLESQMSKDLWPDRPSNSVPSIFRKRKIPLLISPTTTCGSSSVKNTSEKNRETKRGRPKRVGKTETEKADKVAEQRLPLKKRHLHHAQTQESSSSTTGNNNVQSSRDNNTAEVNKHLTGSATARRSSTGRSSRKNSTEDKRPSRPQNKGQSQTTNNTTTTSHQNHVQSQNLPAAAAAQNQQQQQVHVRAQARVEQQQQQQQHNLIKDKPLPPGTGLSPMKDTNIVDSIAACVDKYTQNSMKSKSSSSSTANSSSRPLPTISKDLTQPLTVLTSTEKVSSMSYKKKLV